MSQRRLPLRRQFFDEHNISQKDRVPYPNYRYTKYFWTINLQRKAYSRSQAVYLMELMRKVVLDVFTQGDVVAFAHASHRWNHTYVGNNKLQIGIEVGPNKGRVHAHIIQDIKHRSVINIDPQDVQDEVDRQLRALTGGQIHGVYVNRQLKDSERVLEEYLDKDKNPWRDMGGPVSGIWQYTLQSSTSGEAWDIIQTEDRAVGQIPASTLTGRPVGGNLPGYSGAGNVGYRPGTASISVEPSSFPQSASSSYEVGISDLPAKTKPVRPRVINKHSKRAVK